VCSRVSLAICELGVTRGQVTHVRNDQNDVVALYCGGARFELRPSSDFPALYSS